ncbi:MFS transporter [Salinisphaera sp. P385]|uniref:MFS transporter n=1 Tax=Spectribacter acetivorans TaxID=3075603 RepID=A0ABU3B8J0_9GAMM|nr:MFS transporter [Salinisphaera sp. P385]MDT0617608.1 MFS transporter [Salinisphaera sp. P385]
MRQIIISLTAMFASLALLIAGSSLLGTLLSVQLAETGFSPMAIGLVLVFHSVGFVLGTRVATRLIRRVGQIRSFAAFAAIGCAAALIHPLYVSGWLWALLRLFVGFCHAGLIMVLESWISGRASAATRGALLGIYQIVFFSAAAGGQYLVGFTPDEVYPMFSFVAILMVLSLVPLALTRSEAPVMGSVDRLGFVELWQLSPSGWLGAVVAGLLSSAFLTLGPLYASAIGMDVAGVARYMMFAVVATMLLQWPLGHLSDLMDRRFVLGFLAAAAGIAAVAGMLFGQDYGWALYTTTAIVFGVAGCLYPISLAMITDNMTEGNPVAASAGLLFTFGLGTCLGPLLGAGLMEVLGPAGLFAFLAAGLLLLAGFVVVRMRYTPALPMAQQGRFVNVVASQTAPPILELDPRTDDFRDNSETAGTYQGP